MKTNIALIALGVAVLSIFLYFYFENKDTSYEELEKIQESSMETQSDETKETEDKNEINEEEIKRLFDENLKCMVDIFVLCSLPTEGEPIENTNIYPVKKDIFKSYKEFEDYVRGIYNKETADRLLFDYPFEGVQKYVEVDGDLYINMDYDGGKGYYVDWSSYNIDIKRQSEKECVFSVTGLIEEPAENPVKEPYTIMGTAVYENDKWVLTEMIS